jgi:hypothetical protein
MNNFHIIFFPTGYDFVQTMMVTFKFLPKETNVIVVTDYVDVLKDVKVDFNLTVLKLNDLRDDWSKENEHLIFELDPQKYRDKLAEFYENEIKFPYTHRCILPWLVKNNITKFILADTDCLINFYGEYQETLKLIEEYFGNDQAIFGPLIPNFQTFKEEFIKLCTPSFTKYNIDISIIEDMPEFFDFLDGWFRGFWFDNTEDLMLFYNLWDSLIKEAYKNDSDLLKRTVHAISDEWAHGLVMYVFKKTKNIRTEDPYPAGYRLAKHIYHPENYYFKLPHYSLYLDKFDLVTADSREEFFKINKNKLISFYGVQNGIPEHKIKEVVYDWID